jgi:uncharacterized protein YcnI
MKRTVFLARLVGTSAIFVPATAMAHIEVASGPGFAAATQEITFGVGHGCAGTDTYRVTIDIPSSVTTVRAETSDFGRATVTTDATGLVNAVTWQKSDADALDSDTNYYKLVLRIKVPNQPFTTVYFPAHQTCRASDGTLTVVDWVAQGSTDSGAEPAPALTVLPARHAGWNKFTVPADVTDLSSLFGDAVIVWRGASAYSANPNTADQIGTTAGVTLLTSLASNDEIWVKY